MTAGDHYSQDGGTDDHAHDDNYVQRVFAERGASVYAVLHGDMHIRNGHPIYRFEPFPLRAQNLDSERASQQISWLLRAENRVVDFTGRTEELRSLTDWRDNVGDRMSVLLIHGPGGQGKSRLAARFAVESSEAEWTVWAGHHVSDPTAESVVVPGSPGRKLIVIVEYAERWPADDLQLLLQNPVLRRPDRTRVLLIARPAGEWWGSLRHRLGKAGIHISDTLKLEPLAESLTQRTELFTSARDTFAKIIYPDSDSNPPSAPELHADEFGLVLSIHMAALVAVDSRRRGKAAPDNPIGLSAYLLNREYDYWQSLHDHHDSITAIPEVIGQTAYTAALTGRQPRDRAMMLLDRAGVVTHQGISSVLDDYNVFYPPDDPNLSLEPLHPDRLAEDFIALRTPGHDVDDYFPDPWADTAAGRLLASDNNQSSELAYKRSAIIVMTQAAQRWPHLVHGQLNPILREQPELALASGNAGLSTIAKLPDIDIDVLKSIEALFPGYWQTDLAPGVAAISKRLAEQELPLSDPDHRANIYVILGLRLRHAGLYEEALDATREGVMLLQDLALYGTLRHKTRLAAALRNLSEILVIFGRYEEALEAINKALGLWVTLTEMGSILMEAHTAQGLQTHAMIMSGLGRPEDALASTEASLVIHRRLSKIDSDRFLGGLAGSLMNTAIAYSRQERVEAIDLAGEAVQAFQSLASKNPDNYESDLAKALNTLANSLERNGRHQESVEPAQRAVAIARRIARTNPVAFNDFLASMLFNLAGKLYRVGRHDEAIVAGNESVDIMRQLTTGSPELHQRQTMWILTNFAKLLSYIEMRDRALDLTHEAVSIAERLMEGGEIMPDGDIAESLWLFAELRRQSNVEVARACEAAQRSVLLYRQLSDHAPGVFDQNLRSAEATAAELSNILPRSIA